MKAENHRKMKAPSVCMCVVQWVTLWLDDAFWHVLFSILLAVVMLLWRPSANNQRYLSLSNVISGAVHSNGFFSMLTIALLSVAHHYIASVIWVEGRL